MTFQTYTCPNCKGIGGYHNYPCSGTNWPGAQFVPRQPTTDASEQTGCRPAVPLTETDVRRIVREELAAIRAEAMVPQKESKS